MHIVPFCADYDGCFYYRLRVPFMKLGESDDHRVVFLTNDYTSRYGIPQEIGPDSILVLQRQTAQFTLDYLKFHKERGGKALYELDDDFWNLPALNRTGYHAGNLKITEEIIRNCDGVLTSTPYLAERLKRFGRPTYVAHNCLNLWDVQPYAHCGEPDEDGKIRIGWAGSPTHGDDFLGVVDPIVKAMEARPNVRFVFLGGDYRNFFPWRIRVRMDYGGGSVGKSVDEPATLRFYELVARAKLHVAIAPIVNHIFNHSKSWVKALEYAALGIPVIASNFGPYRDYAATFPTRPIVLASTPKEWTESLIGLIDSARDRAAYRALNRGCVMAHHTLERRIGEWETALSSVAASVAA